MSGEFYSQFEWYRGLSRLKATDVLRRVFLYRSFLQTVAVVPSQSGAAPRRRKAPRPKTELFAKDAPKKEKG